MLAPGSMDALRRLAQFSILFAVGCVLATVVALMRLPNAGPYGQWIVVAAGALAGAMAFAFGVMLSLRKPLARRLGFGMVGVVFAAAALFGLLAAVVPESAALFAAWAAVLLGYAAFATHQLVRWPSVAPADEPKLDVGIFISYRREDSRDIVGRIHDHLRQRIDDKRLFLDVERQVAGEDYRATIARALQQSDVMLVAIGARWLTITDQSGGRRIDDADDPVRLEIEAALDRQVRIIPVLVQGASMPDPDTLPPSLRPFCYRTALAVRPDPDFRNDMQQLVAGLAAG